MFSSKADTLAANAKAQAGIDQYLSGATTITLDGVAYSPTSLKAVFQADSSAQNTADTVMAQWKQAQQTAKSTHATTAIVRKGLRAYIVATFGTKAPAILLACGFTPPKATSSKNTKTKFQAAERSVGTRKLRHTMGKNQKKDIKSTLVVESATTSEAGDPSPVGTAVVSTSLQLGNGTSPKPAAGG